jgi:RNA polymerase sigma-70 factor (ECF subfamily)
MKANPEDAAAFEQFVDAHLDLVYGFAAARIGRQAADVVVAEVFRSALHTFESGDGEMLSRSWLLTCTRGRILDHWRTEAAAAATNMADTLSSEPTTRLGHSWRPEAVLDALDRLPAAQRAVLALRYLEGRPVAEVAHLIDRPHATTQQLLEKARRAFPCSGDSGHRTHRGFCRMTSESSDMFGLEVERALGAAAESPAPISLRRQILHEVAAAVCGHHEPANEPTRAEGPSRG